MLKAIKEIIIMLLVCLVALLLLAVVFYEYIPARKIVAEVTTYNATDTVAQLLTDDIDKKDNSVVLTFEEGEYEVTTKDLKNYEATDKYVPGKSNPFAEVKGEEDDDDSNTTSTSGNSTNSNSSTSTNTNTNSSANTSKNTNSSTKNTNSTTNTNKTDDEYIKDKGTK